MQAAIGWIVLSSAIFAGADPVIDTAHYSENGITFDYPKDWKIKTDKGTKGLVTITATSDSGSTAMLQVYSLPVEPDDILKQVYAAVRKSFEASLVKDSEKEVKRKIAGTELTGKSMEIDVIKGTTSLKQEMYAFKAPSKNRVIFVMFQAVSTEADKAKAGFDAVAKTLAETGDGSGTGSGSKSGSGSGSSSSE